mmetsp:Transcript_52938/g.78470  ORF Transcript_52938/g.78470 Transcript_52938/m.78470 type:complete len:207 (-) Transcript_52938:463-1083(-)
MHHNVLPITNTTLYTTTPVSLCPCCTSVWINVKLIIVVLASQQGTLEAITALKTLCRWNAHAGLGQVRLQLIEHRTANARWYIPGYTRDHATNGIPTLANLVDSGQHLLRTFCIRTTNDVAVHIFHRERVIVHILACDVLHLRHVRQHLDAIVQLQNLPRYRSSRHASNGLPCAAPAAACYRSHPILGIVRGIGMTGPVRHTHVVL